MIDRLIAVLSQPPASFAWSTSADGWRTIGATDGCAIDIWPEKIVAVALFPPDDAALAARSGTLLLLILTALRPDWPTAGDWLSIQMRQATRAKGRYEGPNYTRRVSFVFDKLASRGTLTIQR